MSSEALSARAEFTRSLFAEYEAVRGLKPDDGSAPFWDMVVITAGAAPRRKSRGTRSRHGRRRVVLIFATWLISFSDLIPYAVEAD